MLIKNLLVVLLMVMLMQVGLNELAPTEEEVAQNISRFPLPYATAEDEGKEKYGRGALPGSTMNDKVMDPYFQHGGIALPPPPLWRSTD